MKALRTLSYLFLFGAALVLGLRAGRTTAASLAASHPVPTPTLTQLPPTPNMPSTLKAVIIPGNGQRNLLVIGVDNLRASQPRLESLWMVLYIQGYPQVTLLPVYPQPSGPENSSVDLSLAENFHLVPNGEIDPAFLETLRARQLWWNAYVIIDQKAVNKIFQWRDRVDKESSGIQPLADLPPARDDPHGALDGQQKRIQDLCQAVSLSSPQDFTRLIDLASQHVVTDLDLKKAADELQGLLSQSQRLACEFPTLAVQIGK